MIIREPQKSDIDDIAKLLELKLEKRQARRFGICQIRMEIYNEAFDELIRQITINCVERGLLLIKVRDHLNETLEAYKELYNSSVIFATRKQIEADDGVEDLMTKKKELTTKKIQLQNKKLILTKEYNNLEDNYKTVNENTETAMEKEVAYYKEQINYLKNVYETFKTKDVYKLKEDYERSLNLNK